MTRYSKPPEGKPTPEGFKRHLLWTVKWDSAQVQYAGDEDFGGTMEKVSGTLYGENERGDPDQPLTDFTADRAYADKKSDLLRLEGRIRLTSRDGTRSATCDQVDWHPSKKLLKAAGNVIINTDAYSAGTFKELWASPDLHTAGTPEEFKGVGR